MKDHGERGTQLFQMFQLNSDSSGPPAECNIETEPRQIPAEEPPGQPRKS